jgi:hypothetical protein
MEGSSMESFSDRHTTERVSRAHEARPKTWAEITDDEIVAAVRFASERDRAGLARGSGHVNAALSAPTPEQWPSQPPPPAAQFGLGLIPQHGEGSASNGKIASRLRRMAKAGLLDEIPMYAPRGKRTSPGYRVPGSVT